MTTLRVSDRWARSILPVALLGTILGVLGPFGSYLEHGALLRLVYWTAGLLFGLLPYGVGIEVGLRLTPAGSWRRWGAVALAVAIASVPQAVATRLTALQLWPQLRQVGPGWCGWYAEVAVIGALTAGTCMLFCRLRPAPVPVRPETAPPFSRPVSLGSDVIAL